MLGWLFGQYWESGRRMQEAVGDRAAYGKQLLAYLPERLTVDFGPGFTIANLRNMRQFYQTFPNRYALRSELSWTHYRLLMSVENEERRTWYMNEAADAGWSSRQLDRQIQTFYYDRLLATQGDDAKREVTREIGTTQPVTEADGIVRDPYVLEFLGIPKGAAYLEKDLEDALIGKLQEFLLELGRGFCFVGRQMRINDGTDDYYIDLVFYNYLTRCARRSRGHREEMAQDAAGGRNRGALGEKRYTRHPFETKVAAAMAAVDEGMTKARAMAVFGIASTSPLERWCRAYREGGAGALRLHTLDG